MRHYIIHIILFILSIMIGLACAVSCTSDPDSGLLNSEKGEELWFEVEDCSTRATTITTTSNITSQPFMLFGDVYRNAEFHPGLRTIFEQAKVTYTDSRWDYGVKQYWHMGQEHSFVAIHPYNIKGISNLKYENSKVSFTYKMPEQKYTELESDIKDIIVATHRRKYNRDSDKSGPVKFNFQHLLSRINIAPALSQEDHMYWFEDSTKKDIEFGYDLIRNEFIQIRGVELSGFYTKANVTVTPKSLSDKSTPTDSIDLSIVTVNDSENNTISFEILEKDSPRIYNYKKGEEKNVTVLNDDAAIMMIPQKFSDDAKIKLEYTVNTDNSERNELRSVIVPLKGNELERGKSYLLKFTIKDVYKGQIAESSLKWELNDTVIPNSNDSKKWINDTITISQEFGNKENPNDSEHNNDNEDEG